MRRVLRGNCRVEEVVEFEDDHIYPDASVQIAVLLIQKGPSGGSMRYAFVRKDGVLRQHLGRLLNPSCKTVAGARVLRLALTDGGQDGREWLLHSARDNAFLDQLDAVGKPFAELPVRISLGMCTGADDIFIMKAGGRSNGRPCLTTRRGHHVQLEEAVLKPILRARHSGPGQLNTGYVCVFPYDTRGIILSERILKRRFPAAYQYLRQYKARLASRRLCPGQPWFALRKVNVACHLASPKAIAPTIVGPGGFRLDTEGILCHHGLLTIAPLGDEIDPHYMLGVLNSGVMWRYISFRAGRMGTGRRVLRLGLAKRLPFVLPQTARQQTLAAGIAKLVRQGAAPDAVEPLVRQIYGLEGRELGMTQSLQAASDTVYDTPDFGYGGQRWETSRSSD